MSQSIDPHALNAISSLKSSVKSDLLVRAIRVFKFESPKAIASMQAGLDSNNLAAVRIAAHTLTSSSAYVGAKLFSDRCKDLEIAARENNYTACVELGSGIDDLFEACCRELDAYLIKAA